MPKIFDLCVVTREYEDIRGNKKAVWENIGSLHKNKEGKPFIMLKAHFNPAAIQRRTDSESILVSMFPPKDKDSNSEKNNYDSSAPAQDSFAPQAYDTEVPF